MACTYAHAGICLGLLVIWTLCCAHHKIRNCNILCHNESRGQKREVPLVGFGVQRPIWPVMFRKLPNTKSRILKDSAIQPRTIDVNFTNAERNGEVTAIGSSLRWTLRLRVAHTSMEQSIGSRCLSWKCWKSIPRWLVAFLVTYQDLQGRTYMHNNAILACNSQMSIH